MKRFKLLSLIALFSVLFVSCEEPKEEPTYYKIINNTGSTITDIKIYELDANNAVIRTLTADDEDSEYSDVVSVDYNSLIEADKDAVAVKVSFKIIGETYTTIQNLRINNKSEIIIERPDNLTTYTVEFNVNADWDDDDYLYLVEIDERNANGSLVQRQEFDYVYGLGGKIPEYKAHSNTKTVQVFFYMYPEAGHDGGKSKEFTITKGEYNEIIVYGGECEMYCKSASGEKKTLKNEK